MARNFVGLHVGFVAAQLNQNVSHKMLGSLGCVLHANRLLDPSR
jgi:hypothetical protein